MSELSLLDRIFVFLQHVVPQHWLSRIVGWLASSRLEPIKNFLIRQFIKQFDVNMAEAANPDPTSYNTFNDFFTRELQADSRPIDTNPDTLCSPADGAISESGPIDKDRLLQAKGFYYELQDLMGGDADLYEPFVDGDFCTIYLSPRDYHRVHMPCDGKLIATRYVPGKLFSVNSVTARSVPHLFSRNERLICLFESDKGPFALVLVGAMIVAGIETVWAGQVTPLSRVTTKLDFTQPIVLKKGEEMGRFKLGSTVIALFPNNMLNKEQFAELMQEGKKVAMGETLAYLA